MHRLRGTTGRLLACFAAVAALFVFGATASADRAPSAAPGLHFKKCGLTAQAATTECATADLPLDYDQPRSGQVHIAIARVPAADKAHRIGVLFFNFGGPGGTAVDYLQNRGASTLWKALNQRFDIIGFDPRGVGQSTPVDRLQGRPGEAGHLLAAVHDAVQRRPQRTRRQGRELHPRVRAQNGNILSHVSTANVARDMDAIRGLLGETKLNYFGYSYGTFLGATYASLFPDRYRAMVLDGPIDATAYINQPWRDLAEQTAGFERALGRFFQACAGNQDACSNFGGSDPWDAYDKLVESANTSPIPADRRRRRPSAGRRRRHQLRASRATSTRRSSGRRSARRSRWPRTVTAR